MKGLTLTIVTPKIQSINYGETIGNVSTLKKLSTGTGSPKRLITYFSDKAIKFDVKRIGREQFNWNLMDSSVVEVFSSNYHNGVFDYDNFLKEMVIRYDEFDLFGGMFADISNIRGKIKQCVADEDQLRAFIDRLEGDEEVACPGMDRPLPVKKLREYLKILLESKGKTLFIRDREASLFTFDREFRIDTLKADSQSLKELKQVIGTLGENRIEVRIDAEEVKIADVKKLIEAIETVKSFTGCEVSCEHTLRADEVSRLQRLQPVRFSNGYSISEFAYDMNFLNDIDAYNRYIQHISGKRNQAILYPEEHFSHYTYTLTIDLDRAGAIERDLGGRVMLEPVVSPEVRTRRIRDVLEIVLLYLNRRIRGRHERLTPVFMVGGVYDVKHPFFANAIHFREENQKLCFNVDDLKEVLDMYRTCDVASNTFLYFHDSFVEARGKLPDGLKKQSLHEILHAMVQKVSDYYGLWKSSG